jgi:C-terminal, D2-small domain, of ClpB protein
MKRIVDIQLKHLQALLAGRKIVLEVDETTKTWRRIPATTRSAAHDR